MTTSGRLIQIAQAVTNGEAIRTLETGEFGMALDSNDEKLWIGSNTGNIRVVTERDITELAVPDNSIGRQELTNEINDLLDQAASGTNINVATTTSDGLMSSEDKNKLNAIEAEANKTEIINNLTSLSTSAALSAYQGRVLKGLIDDITAGGGVIDNLTSTVTDRALSANQGRILKGLIDAKPNNSTVTNSSNGLMTSSDKQKLDNIQANANNTIIVNNLTSDSTTSALSARQGKVLKDLIDSTVSNIIVVRDNLTSNEATNALSARQGVVLKGLIDAKAPNTVASQTTNGLMSASDKVKLDNLSSGGGGSTVQVLDVLTSHSNTAALSANQGRLLNLRFETHITNSDVHVSSIEKTRWDNKANSTVATTSANGLMSSADKTKLNGLYNTTVLDNLTSTSTNNALSANQGRILKNLIDAKSGTSVATTSVDGLMSSADKAKLNGISAGATNVTVLDSLNSTSPTIALSANQGRVLKGLIDDISSSSGSISNIYQTLVTTGTTGTGFGRSNEATGTYSFVAGSYSVASGGDSIALGDRVTASGTNAMAINYNTVASGQNSFALGQYSSSSGAMSISGGSTTESKNYASVALGHHSNMTLSSATSYNSTADAFVIGNGSSSTYSNAFRVTFDGKVFGRANYASSGADYAEYFEWLDGNINTEDRVGYFVTLEGDKIRKAKSTDSYVLGIISANPSVTGDSASEGWNEQYIRDEFGRIQYEYVDIEYEELNENGENVKVIRNEYHPKYNPNYDPSKDYIARENRKEWDAVGMMGKLLVRDDGTCEVNGYCKSNDEGIATKSEEGYRVMKRISENIVQVLVK